MQRVVWIVAAIGFVLWSILAWLGHVVLGWLADFATRNADQLTIGGEFADWLTWAADLIGAAGGTLIVIVWLFGSIVIAVLAFVISKLAQRYVEGRSDRYQVLPPGHR